MVRPISIYLAENGFWRAYGRDPLAPSPDPGWVEGWGTPTWRDEFNGAVVDTNNWTIRDATYLSYDWAVIDADNATIVDNQLQLRMSELVEPVEMGGKERWWQTAYLDTIGKLEERYGRWEMRAKIPTTAGNSRGVWPAFWLRNGDQGEIDIMESWGDPPKRERSSSLTETSTFTLHQYTSISGGASAGWTYEHRVATPGPPYQTAQGFHTWAVEVTPTYIKAFFDNMLAVHVTPDGAGGTPAYPWAWGPSFDSPWNIRLNIQMGDPYWTENPTPSELSDAPADFLIDYVRYWALPEGE